MGDTFHEKVAQATEAHYRHVWNNIHHHFQHSVFTKLSTWFTTFMQKSIRYCHNDGNRLECSYIRFSLSASVTTGGHDIIKKSKFVYIATAHRHLVRDVKQSCDTSEGTAASIFRADLADSSEKSVHIYQNTQHYIPEDSRLHITAVWPSNTTFFCLLNIILYDARSE